MKRGTCLKSPEELARIRSGVLDFLTRTRQPVTMPAIEQLCRHLATAHYLRRAVAALVFDRKVQAFTTRVPVSNKLFTHYTASGVEPLSQVFDLIRGAILCRHQLHATFAGMRRELCPHAIGYLDGIEQVLCYQFAGSSPARIGPAGSPTNWRCLEVGRLTDVAIVPGPWHTGPSYEQWRQRCIPTVIEEVRLPALEQRQGGDHGP